MTRTDSAGMSRRARSQDRLSAVGEDPDYRYSLANERTFLSWIRTSLALIAAGVAIVQYAPDLGPRWLRLVLGISLILVAGAISGSAHYRWLTRERAMRLKQTLPRNRIGLLLGYGLAVIAVAAIVVLLVPAR